MNGAQSLLKLAVIYDYPEKRAFFSRKCHARKDCSRLSRDNAKPAYGVARGRAATKRFSAQLRAQWRGPELCG